MGTDQIDEAEGYSYGETDGRDGNQRSDEGSEEHSNDDQDQRDRYRIDTLNVRYSLRLNVVVESRLASYVNDQTLIADDIRDPDIMPYLGHAVHRVRTVRPEIDNHQHRVVLGRCELRIHIPARLHRIGHHVVVAKDLQPENRKGRAGGR